MLKISHLSSVHKRFDVRIFLKQCSSLSKFGYKLTLIIADGNGDDIIDNIKIIDVGKPKSRFERMFITTKKIHKQSIDLNADIYHLHDPELVPVGLKLKKLGKKVIFDAHEDIPNQLLTKPYFHKIFLLLLSRAMTVYEELTYHKFDGIISATPYIRDKLIKINPRTIDINNFPLLRELRKDNTCWSNKKNQVCYIGGISKRRGIVELVLALNHSKENTRLKIAGEFSESDLLQDLKKQASWKNVDYLGFLNREEVSDLLDDSMAGLVTLHPEANYLDSLPVKMFEYMAAGIPVIASNFSLWKNIIEKYNCGLCVDPMNPKAISEAIDYLTAHPGEAEKMGQNGKFAVQKHFNWLTEEKKLLKFYQEL